MKPATTSNNKDSSLCARIMKRVRGRGRGAAFTSRDFSALGKPGSINSALARLAKSGVLRRVARGIYDWPSTIASLGITAAPSVEAVVEALARHDNARLVPDGAQAANRLGLSTQVPARDSYVSTGRSHRITLGKSVIHVRHVSSRMLAGLSARAALALSALRYLGARDVDSDDITRLRQVLAPRDKATLRRAAPNASVWMGRIIAQIVAA